MFLWAYPLPACELWTHLVWNGLDGVDRVVAIPMPALHQEDGKNTMNIS